MNLYLCRAQRSCRDTEFGCFGGLYLQYEDLNWNSQLPDLILYVGLDFKVLGVIFGGSSEYAYVFRGV